ncbi:MAG TPA: NUDIX domain-containing protein [Verrucomicrobiae bacterium]|nr:NUDIX domain-containing protein [Verrucomicrobiae bacterium]
MQEVWQLYGEDGQPLTGQGASKDDAYTKGLLHAASQIWIWRYTDSGVEVLVQKRAAGKRTWPNFYDISVGGHINLGETPEAAGKREAQEELGLDVQTAMLESIGRYRVHVPVGDTDDIENEFQYMYLLQVAPDTAFILDTSELASVEWKPLDTFMDEVYHHSDLYVPHGNDYFEKVIQALRTKPTP